MARDRAAPEPGKGLGEAAGDSARAVDPDFGAGATAGLAEADEAPTTFGAGAASSIRMEQASDGEVEPGGDLGSLVGALVDDLLGSDPLEASDAGPDDDPVGGRLGDAVGELADGQADGGDDAVDGFA